MDKFIEKLKKTAPLVHCITNTVTINSCANALLAIGARPIMAVYKDELSDISKQSDALLLNIGTITDFTAESVIEAARISTVPTVLDCVGAAASHYRLKLVHDITAAKCPTVIKGNASEIAAVCGAKMSMSGVDAAFLNVDIDAVYAFSKKLNTTVVVTGEKDMVFSKNGITTVENGCSDMTRVTGTGCITGCLMAAFSTVSKTPAEAAVQALVTMGVCGETARTDKGTGTFYVNLLDALSTIDDDVIAKRKKVEHFERKS